MKFTGKDIRIFMAMFLFAVQFAPVAFGAACPRTGLIASRSFEAGAAPQHVAIADLDGDSFPDLAVASATGLQILLGNGAGDFRNVGSYLRRAAFVLVRDLNGDQKQDVVAVDFGQVWVLAGNGDGTFQTAVAYAAGGSPNSATVEDLNGDGKLDLAVVNGGSSGKSDGGVSVLLGAGNGTFARALNFAAGQIPVGIAAADFNRDSKTDLAVVNSGTPSLGNTNASISILLGKGDGQFLSPLNYPARVEANSITCGDFNSDGVPDLAVANAGPSAAQGLVVVLLGLGDGSFKFPALLRAGGRPKSIIAGDINRDGKLDLVVANDNWIGDSPVGGGKVSVLFGNGDGTFQTVVNYTEGSSPLSAALGDLDQDGWPDVVIANRLKVCVLLGQGNGALQSASYYPTGGRPSSVVTGDFNGDGRSDLAVANTLGGSVSLLLGIGDGRFQRANNSFLNFTPAALVAADLNRDGQLDLAVSIEGESATGQLAVMFGNGRGAFQNPIRYATGSRGSRIASADFDRDGAPDLVTTTYQSENISLLLAKTNGGFQSVINYPASLRPFALTPGDFNRDGRPDIAVIGDVGPEFDGKLSILFGNGDGTFQAPVTNVVTRSPRSLVMGDFNKDGIADLAAGFLGISHGITAPLPDSIVSIFLGDGTGKFRESQFSHVGSDPESLAVADLNADGNPDLAVGSYLSSEVSLLFGNGDGTFRVPITWGVGMSPAALAVGDFDRDGRFDLVSANTEGGTISVLLNSCDASPRLAIQGEAQQTTVSWLDVFAGTGLKSAASLTSIRPNWTPILGSAIATNGRWRITLPNDSTQRYFRLSQP